MEDASSHNINQENIIENKINLTRFDFSLFYVLILNKICSLKNQILRRKLKIFFLQRDILEKEYSYRENRLSKIKNVFIMKENKNIFYESNANNIKKRKNNIKDTNIAIKYYILKFLK